jgi:hypothetical protein
MSIIREFLFGQKAITDAGLWSDKKMPKSGSRFPLRGSKGVHLGIGFRWRIVELEVNGRQFRLLVAYDPAKQNFSAYLALCGTSSCLVLARLEYHSTHPGWHVHACCESSEARQWGRVGYPEMNRIPANARSQRNIDFCADDDDAITIAAKHFRIPGLIPPRRYKQQSLLSC